MVRRAERIALVHYTAPPVVGGVETVLAAQARSLARAGRQVRVVAGRGRAAAIGVPVVRIPLLDARHPRLRSARAALEVGHPPADFELLVDELEGALADVLGEVDVVVVHNLASVHFNLAASVALRKLAATAGRGWLLWVHDVAAAMPDRVADLHPGWPWDVVRTAWPGSRVVAVSELRRDQYAQVTGLAPETIGVVPNGIDIPASLRLHPATRRLVEATGLLEAAPILLVPSRLVPRKNIELALEVAAVLARTEPQLRLVVTGALDPHDRGALAYRSLLLRRRAELGLGERVVFVAEHVRGGATDAVVRDLYRLADLLFLPSRDEGFGLPILEAAVTRLPIVCADIPALRAVTGTGAVRFAPDASAAEVAELIRRRLDADPAFGLARSVRRGLSWEALGPRLLALVDEVAG
jgi:glycosyltransferase involved in cell wall biosynthesis